MNNLKKLAIVTVILIIWAFISPAKTFSLGSDCNTVDYIWGIVASHTDSTVTFEIHNVSASCTTEVGVSSFIINSGDPFSSMDQTFYTGNTIQMGPGVQNLTVNILRCNSGVGWQADAFIGPLAPGSDLYFGRLLASLRGQKDCSTATSPTPTFPPDVPTPTLPPGITITPTSQPVCPAALPVTNVRIECPYCQQ